MKKIIFTILVVFSMQSINAQLIQEYEINVGYSIFQGDYGIRGRFPTTLGNYGGVLGGKAYFKLLGQNDDINCYSCNHLKFPLYFNVGYSLLNFDRTDYSTSTPAGLRLRSFRGRVFHTSVSFGIEYHIGDLFNISNINTSFFSNFDPYFGATGGVAAYVTRLKSDLGDFKADPSILPESFRGGRIFDHPGIVPMVSLEAGLRFKISKNTHGVITGKWLYYLSDKVDGVVPNPELVDNLYNDWQFVPSFGIIFR